MEAHVSMRLNMRAEKRDGIVGHIGEDAQTRCTTFEAFKKLWPACEKLRNSTLIVVRLEFTLASKLPGFQRHAQ